MLIANVCMSTASLFVVFDVRVTIKNFPFNKSPSMIVSMTK